MMMRVCMKSLNFLCLCPSRSQESHLQQTKRDVPKLVKMLHGHLNYEEGVI